MAPKPHRFAVNDEIMLHLQSLLAQPVVASDIGVQCAARGGRIHTVLPQLRHPRLDGASEPVHLAQEGC